MAADPRVVPVAAVVVGHHSSARLLGRTPAQIHECVSGRLQIDRHPARAVQRERIEPRIAAGARRRTAARSPLPGDAPITRQRHHTRINHRRRRIVVIRHRHRRRARRRRDRVAGTGADGRRHRPVSLIGAVIGRRHRQRRCARRGHRNRARSRRNTEITRHGHRHSHIQSRRRRGVRGDGERRIAALADAAARRDTHHRIRDRRRVVVSHRDRSRARSRRHRVTGAGADRGGDRPVRLVRGIVRRGHRECGSTGRGHRHLTRARRNTEITRCRDRHRHIERGCRRRIGSHRERSTAALVYVSARRDADLGHIVVSHRDRSRARSRRHRVTGSGAHRRRHRPVCLVRGIVRRRHRQSHAARRGHRDRPRARRHAEITRHCDRHRHIERGCRRRISRHREHRVAALADIGAGCDADLGRRGMAAHRGVDRHPARPRFAVAERPHRLRSGRREDGAARRRRQRIGPQIRENLPEHNLVAPIVVDMPRKRGASLRDGIRSITRRIIVIGHSHRRSARSRRDRVALTVVERGGDRPVGLVGRVVGRRHRQRGCARGRDCDGVRARRHTEITRHGDRHRHIQRGCRRRISRHREHRVAALGDSAAGSNADFRSCRLCGQAAHGEGEIAADGLVEGRGLDRVPAGSERFADTGVSARNAVIVVGVQYGAGLSVIA